VSIENAHSCRHLSLFLLIYTAILVLNALMGVDLNSSGLYAMLLMFLRMNIVLAIFNMIPIPPLDGHHILNMCIPLSLRHYWDVFLAKGQILLFVAFFIFSSAIGEVIAFVLGVLGLS